MWKWIKTSRITQGVPVLIVGTVVAAASISPEEAQSNLSGWLSMLGLDQFASMITPKLNDNIFWFASGVLITTLICIFMPEIRKVNLLVRDAVVKVLQHLQKIPSKKVNSNGEQVAKLMMEQSEFEQVQEIYDKFMSIPHRLFDNHVYQAYYHRLHRAGKRDMAHQFYQDKLRHISEKEELEFIVENVLLDWPEGEEGKSLDS